MVMISIEHFWHDTSNINGATIYSEHAILPNMAKRFDLEIFQVVVSKIFYFPCVFARAAIIIMLLYFQFDHCDMFYFLDLLLLLHLITA